MTERYTHQSIETLKESLKGFEHTINFDEGTKRKEIVADAPKSPKILAFRENAK